MPRRAGSGAEEAAEEAARQAARCLGCGFCEAACPTLRHGPHRGYGPRGRVLAAAEIAAGRASPEALASVFSCLLCRACIPSCPVGIDVPGLARLARSIALARGLAGFSIESRG